ncbi:hypothetical protein [Paenibacillus baekrokdamisoli]|uniref:hypothetical protein n=1 Tax=Paenibacillus baekrokdamisoli TaxID=1712516 RepID=UPI001E656BC5|nr:hypothetical protein [Paenibacillus baekrokdamisoli]
MLHSRHYEMAVIALSRRGQQGCGNPVQEGRIIKLYALPLGPHSLTVIAQDFARKYGNRKRNLQDDGKFELA